jgi:thiamine-phosphate pyrophosphorylase
MKALYVTDRKSAGDARVEDTLAALSGAPDISVQLRERETPDRECLRRAEIARRTLGPEVALFVNRRFDIALAAAADGVHLPASGLPLARVRAGTPRGFRIGVSTHSPEEARLAIEAGADLVLIGPIFDTPSKAGFGPPLGVEALGQLPPRSEHGAQVLAIGGIREEDLDRLEPWRDRIAGVAGIRLFQDADDPGGVARRIALR